MKKPIAVSIIFASLNAVAKVGSTENVQYAGDLDSKNYKKNYKDGHCKSYQIALFDCVKL
jgi:hypothetical protein